MPGLLVFNPKAGAQNPELLPELASSLWNVVTASIEECESGVLDRIRAEGCEWVAVAGGDGTVEFIARELLGSDVPLGIIPVGTYNNFARSLALPLEPAAACEVIRAGHAEPVDVGFVNGRPFFECVGAGLDAALFPYGEEIKSGRFTGAIDLLKLAFRYPKHRFTLRLDTPACDALVHTASRESRRAIKRLCRHRESVIHLKGFMVTVSNGAYYGMNFTVAPDQRMNDGMLTVTVFSRYSKIQLWRHFLTIAFGRKEYCPRSIAFCVRKLEITSSRVLPVHLDGSPEDLWPISIECRPGCLKVFRAHP